MKTKYSNTNPLLSSLSDLSLGSSAAEHGGDTMQGSAAPAGRSQARERLLTEVKGLWKLLQTDATALRISDLSALWVEEGAGS